jgi:hypothetical protein
VGSISKQSAVGVRRGDQKKGLLMWEMTGSSIPVQLLEGDIFEQLEVVCQNGP